MQARSGLEAIVGKNNVLDDPTILEGYSSDLSFVPRVRPKLVVKPGCTAEVQEVVKWANTTSTPLVPVSSGSPHFRGDTIPVMGGSVILDLSRMKKIIRVDAKNRVAIVEPGVTFSELQPALYKEGLTGYLPLCPRSSKSVVGSILEREPITTPNHHWDSLDPFLCGEMVFGTGDIMRSGEAAGPDTIEEQWAIGKAQITPYGPGQFDPSRLISGAQGTIGIVTWASVKCRPLSKLNRTFMVPSETVEPLIELSYQLVRARLGTHFFIVNDLNLAALLAQDSVKIQKLRESLPRWTLIVSFEGYGVIPEKKVKYEEADFMEMLSGTGLKAVEEISDANAEDIWELLSGPLSELSWKLRYKGGCQETFFLTTLDQTPKFINAMDALADSCQYRGEDLGVYLQMSVQGTSCHCEFDLYYDPANSTEAERTKSLVLRSSSELIKMGAFFSRPYGQVAKVAYAQAVGTTIMQRKVKGIFDPNNILNPGKLCF